MDTATLDLDLDLINSGAVLETAGPPELALVLGALSDPIRLRIVAGLADGGEHACGSFGLPITKSTCSHHFRVLREAGLVSTRINGKTRLNRLRRETIEDAFPGLLDSVLSAYEP